MENKYGIDIEVLKQVRDRDRRELMVFRENRRDVIDQYVGSRWSENGSKKDVPVNMIGLYCQIVTYHLVAQDPRCMIGTASPDLKWVVEAMESWINKQLPKMKFGRTLQKLALDALISVGICKLGLVKPSESALRGYRRNAGDVYFARVSLDDWAHDTKGKSQEEWTYCGHKYTAPIDAVKDSKLFTKVRKKLEPRMGNALFTEVGDETAAGMSQSQSSSEQEIEPMVDLWEFWFPRKGLVLTMHDDFDEPLRVEKYIGPSCGDYHIYGFQDVPDNFMPKPPVIDQMPMHEHINGLERKLARQGSRQKNLLLIPNGTEGDAERINKTPDGGSCRIDGQQIPQEVSFGGPNQQNAWLAQHFKNLCEFVGGNFGAVGGLGKQSNTLGQDQLIQQNAGHTIGFMQNRHNEFTADLLRSFCWWKWHHPTEVMDHHFVFKGQKDISIPWPIKPEDRLRPFEDLEIDVDAYSMLPDTPDSRAGKLIQLLQITQPYLPLLLQQGKAPDIIKIVQKIGKYWNMPDVSEIWGTAPRVESEEGSPLADMGQPQKPANTTRTYQRMDSGPPTDGAEEAMPAAQVSAPMNGRMQ